MFIHKYIILGLKSKRDILYKKINMNQNKLDIVNIKKHVLDITRQIKSSNNNLVSSSGYKKLIKGIVGHPKTSATLTHFKSKNIVYSFIKTNNLYPIFSGAAIEYLLTSFFLSMYSLISKPVYLIKQDKIIIQLFIFLSPKADKFLDSNTFFKEGKLRTASKTIFSSRITHYLKFKSFRPKTLEILNNQIANTQHGNTREYTSFLSNFNSKLEKLSLIFSKILNKKVEFHLVKAQLPYQDSKIISQILGYNADKYNFRKMLKMIIPRAVIKNPSKEIIPPTSYPMLALFNLSSPLQGIKRKGETDLTILQKEA